MADSSQVKEITEKLEQGVKDLFSSDTYAAYLQTMSRFHNYSTRNTQLIHLQMPSATVVAGFQAWQTKFERHVKKGEKSIKIFAPIAYNKREEKEVIDPVTRMPVIGEDGMPVIEYTERKIARFKVASVFDVSQTEGKPLPSLAQDITGNVERYEAFMDALRTVSPLPIVFEQLPEDTDGECRLGKEIAVREGMSEIQTVCAVIHEITHAKLHDLESLRLTDENVQASPKDHRTEEVEAESVSFCVNNYFSIETGANSFGYIANWSKGRELKELNASLDTIRKTAAEMIDAIESKFQEIAKERDISFEQPPAPDTDTPAIIAAYTRNAEVRNPRQEGQTILLPLLFEGGNVNRDGKRSRVKVEPLIGKYEIFSRDIGTPPYSENYLYLMSASGYLVQLGEAERLKDITEQRIDKYIIDVITQLDKQLADPKEWADFAAAALSNRVAEAETHNAPVRELREAERQAERELQNERDKQLAAEKQGILDARVDEIAKVIENGGNIQVAYDAGAHGGKNPVLELFKLYGVEIPLRTQGWVNNRLAAIKGDSYSFYTRNGGKASEAFMDCLHKLTAAVKQTPIEQKRGVKAAGQTIATTEVKDTLEHQIYEKFAAMFPEFMKGEYETLRLEAENAKPLELEWVFGDTVSIAHTYELNGEPAYEPRVVLKVNSEEKTMTASSLELSEPPRMDNVYNDRGGADTERQRNINRLMIQWLDRAAKQRFRPVEATFDVDEQGNISKAGLVGDKTVKVTFGADGKPVMPERNNEPQPSVADPVANGIYEKYRNIVAERAAAYAVSSAVLFKTDKADARKSCDQIVNRVVNDLLLEAGEHYPLYKQYAQNEDFKGQLEDYAFVKAYLEPKTAERAAEQPDRDVAPEKEYDLGYGFLGNGITVWNRAEQKNGDYVTVAHIAPDRSVSFYDKDMPHDVKQRIDTVANSPDTWAFGFSRAPENIPPHIDGLPAPASVYEDIKRILPETADTKAPDPSLPDPLTTIAEQNEYGYDYDGMLPLSNLRAAELFDADLCIYLLYPDNTEAMAVDRDEIINHDGLCGIEREDWERSSVRAKQIAAAVNADNDREADLLYGNGNKFGIYQIRDGIDEARNFRFAPMRELEALGLIVNRANYELVYTAPLTERIEFLSDRYPVLNKIYEDFNIRQPADYAARSLSVSDVVVLKYNGDIASFYVDSGGFKELDAFLGDETQWADALKREQERNANPENNAPDTYSQVGNRSEDYTGKTSAELETDVKAGKVISLSGLSKAVNAERGGAKERKDIPKSKKPTLMERLEAGRRRAAAQDGQKSAPHRDSDKEARA